MPPIELIRLIRPRHWVKNVLVLLPVIFAVRFLDPRAWALALTAAAGFSLVSSAVYIFNDIRDRRADAVHPVKRNRPIAAGRVGVPAAAATLAACLVVGLALCALVNAAVLAIAGGYAVLQALYTLWLKHRMLLDVIVIALGFVLRAVAGAVAIQVVASPWLIICTFTICLFLGFCKRRMEVAALVDAGQAEAHRLTLRGYSLELLTHLITLSAVLAIVSYLLYVTSGVTIAHFDTAALIYTLPIVLYAVCRFAMLSMMGSYGDPTDLILHDRPFQGAALVWLAAVMVVIRYGEQFAGWGFLPS